FRMRSGSSGLPVVNHSTPKTGASCNNCVMRNSLPREPTMKNVVVAVGALASVAVLSGNAWACEVGCRGPRLNYPRPSPPPLSGGRGGSPGYSSPSYQHPHLPGGRGGGAGFGGGILGSIVGIISAGIAASKEITTKAEPEPRPVRRAAQTE